MSTGEDEVVEYIDTLLGDAPAGTLPTPTAEAAASPGACEAVAAATVDTPGAPAVAGGTASPAGPAHPVAPAPAAAAASPLAPAAAVAPEARVGPAPAHASPPPEPPPAHVRAPAPRWLRVRVGQASYALELLRVQEVVRLMPIVAMRGADAAVLGVMNLRGRIVPVFDLGLWLGTGRVEPGDQGRIVVVERDDELIGLLVSAVEDVVTLGRDRIEPALPGDDRGVVLGVARVGDVPTVLFDAHALYR